MHSQNPFVKPPTKDFHLNTPDQICVKEFKKYFQKITLIVQHNKY